MRQEDISEGLGNLAFSFFYKYSRFEFALKENGFLSHATPGRPAKPGWLKFARKHCDEYHISTEARKLIDAAPKCQIVGANGRLEWKDVDFTLWPAELAQVIRLLQTVRNNLFHGGKHGADGWDDPARTETLLTLAVTVLDQIAKQARFEVDYFSYY